MYEVKGVLADQFGLRKDDAISRVNGVDVTIQNWRSIKWKRPCEIEFIRISPEFHMEHPKRRYHSQRKARSK